VMLRHLGTAQAILTSAMAGCSPAGAVDPSTIHLISQAEAATINMYGTLGMGELALLRHTLARQVPDVQLLPTADSRNSMMAQDLPW